MFVDGCEIKLSVLLSESVTCYFKESLVKVKWILSILMAVWYVRLSQDCFWSLISQMSNCKQLRQVKEIQQMLISSFLLCLLIPLHVSASRCHLQEVTISLFISYSRLSAFRVGVGYCYLGVAICCRIHSLMVTLRLPSELRMYCDGERRLLGSVLLSPPGVAIWPTVLSHLSPSLV
jgi:hypothetical protein